MTQFTNLVELLQYRGEYQLSENAYIFLKDGEVEAERLTYQHLDQKARAIAANLQELGLEGERALLLYPSSLDFIPAFFGCLYAGVIAVPAYPPKNNQKLDRLQSIMADAMPKAILAPSSVVSAIQKHLTSTGNIDNICYLETEQISLDLAATYQPLDVKADSIAFLQYTSGSTGKPKGVMVSHSNIMHNQKLIQQGFGHDEKSVVLGWLPLFHDMGLIGNILQPLYVDIPYILMTPIAFLQKPIRWLQAISDYKATSSGGPNFAYDLCLRKISDAQKSQLDLSHWQVAFNGAQPIQSNTLEKFVDAFAECGFRREAFYPCYGMAETTLIVSGSNKNVEPIIQIVDTQALEANEIVAATTNSEKTKSIVGCGQILGDLDVVIAHPETLLECASNQVGEIWVAGSSVTQGYWQQDEQNKETFQAYLKGTGKGPFLRTGDLGFLQNNELFITGRLKDLIIIRGRNHYPQDIESTTAKSHPALEANASAAFAIDADGEEKLFIVQEVKRSYVRKLNSAEVIEAIRRDIALEHELQVSGIILISPGRIPKTSSGKVQRRRCRQAYLENTLKVIAKSVSSKSAVNPSAPAKLNPKTNGVDLSPLPVKPLPIPATLKSQPETAGLSAVAPAQSQSRANQMIQWFQDYANHRINSHLIDERRCIPPYVLLDLGNQGFLGMQVAENYGGMGLNISDSLRVIQQVAAADLTIASLLGVHSALGIRPIANYGQTAVKNEILPLLAHGRELGAYALTEPIAGSHPKSISTTATPDGKGGWLLQGEKMYIGNGSWAGSINVFAQLLDNHHHPLGITSFVVRQGVDGLEQGPEALTMGMRGMVQNRIYFNQVRVTSEMMLGQPGEGMTVGQDAMMFGRLGLGAMSIGGMKRCAQLMLRYATRRTVATGTLFNNPITLHRLHDLTSSITAVETLVERISRLLDQGIELPEEAYIACKTAGPEFFWQAVDNLMQLLGGRGYLENNIVPRMMRDARLMRIFEGPTETLHMFLGSRVLHQNEQLHRLLTDLFGCPQLFQKLQTAAQDIYSDCTSNYAPFPDPLSATRWAYSVIGELATLTILEAALRTSPIETDQQCKTLTWLEAKFRTVLQNALAHEQGDSDVCYPERLQVEIKGYTATIGDLEQTLAGEEWALDSLIRKQGMGQTGTAKPSTHPLLQTHEASAPLQTHEASAPLQAQSVLLSTAQSQVMEQWMANWLEHNLNLPVGSFDVAKTFAEYGMDSVTAVEFVQDLENQINRPLDPTVIWNYSTPQALAQYLAKPSTGDKPTNSAPVDTLQNDSDAIRKESSEVGLAELLAEEIERSKQFATSKIS